MSRPESWLGFNRRVAGNGADDGGGDSAGDMARAIDVAVGGFAASGGGAASPCSRALRRAQDNVDCRLRPLTVTLQGPES